MAKTKNVLGDILDDYRALIQVLAKSFLTGLITFEENEAAWESWVETGNWPEWVRR